MDLMVALENDKTWTTKAGVTIPINELEDRHLLNIINMITVRAPIVKERVVLEAVGYSSSMMGDMAQLAVDQEVRALEDTDPIELISQLPLMKALLKEAKKRKVI